VDSWLRDLKYAFRSIAGSKAFAVIVVCTMALGTGANTAVFGVLHAVVLQPLPYEEPERLVRVYHSVNGAGDYLTGIAAVAYRDRSQTLEFAPLYTYSANGADLTDGAEPERVRMLPVGSDYFGVLRARPILGRTFERADERANAHVVVISERVWRTHLGGAADVVGRQLTLNGVAHRIAAVLPAGFDDPLESGIDVWTPLNLQPGGPNSFDNYYLSAIGRLKPGATLEQAQAELAMVASSLQPADAPARERWSVRVAPLQVDTVGSAGPLLWMLLGAVGLLLIIACVNVASLFLARGAARETELAVRGALGCSGWRLVRQLLVESVLLSVVGALGGLVLSRLMTISLMAAAPQTIAHAGSEGIARTVFVFGLGVAVLAGVGFGVAPAWQATRPDLDAVLRESGRGGSASRRHTRGRNMLVVAQMGLALVLLAGAGLLLRSVDRLRSANLGIRPANVLTLQVHLPEGRYGDPAKRARFHRDFERRLAALPGARAAGAISRLPATGTYHSWGARRPDRPGTRFLPTQNRVIEGAYFDAVGIPLLSGRTFGPGDDVNAPRRVVISEELVRQLYPTEDPVGRSLRVAGGEAEIIGVVGDVALGPRATPRPYVYHSHSQYAADRNWALTQVVAFDGNRAPSLGDIRRDLAQIDPGLVLYQPKMLDEVVAGGMAQERFALLLLASFALLAIVLAAIGLYGVLSYSVTRRRREMGIRMALGAPAGAVRWLVVRDGSRLALAGIVLGFGLSLVATRALRSLLFGVSATEPIVFATAAGVLAMVAIVASWIPARAATRLDPLQAVRD
jgi:putative ABC transport system permease protein